MIASPDISGTSSSPRPSDSSAPSAFSSPSVSSSRNANASERSSAPSPHPAAPDPISPHQRLAHLLVLDMINANLPLPRLADHLKIPFDTLISYINTPEVQAEINAYEALITLRARLLGEAARPISLRRLLDVLESPAPKLSGHDPDADTRALHRHAELIRRTATTIARESRALAPKAAPKPAPKHASDQLTQKGAPSASSGSSSISTSLPSSSKGASSASTSSSASSSSCASSNLGAADFSPRGSASSPPTSLATRPSPASSQRPSPVSSLHPSSPVRSLHSVCGSTRARDHPAV